MDNEDRYASLKPPSPTLADEICACEESTPIVIKSSLTYNPIACVDCNGEIAPDRLEMSPELIQAIVSWRYLHDALYALWLDSREFEQWAADQLLNPNGPATTRGLQLCGQMPSARRCYFWFFQDTNAPDYTPRTTCPVCSGTLEDRKVIKHRRLCNHCGILIGDV